MHKQGKSWGLWLVPAIGGLIVLGGAYSEMLRRPSNAQDELRIALQELRSQLEEGGLLATHAKNGDPPRNFVREHARQLERHMQATVDDVRMKGSRADQGPVGELAAKRGQDAMTSLHRMGSSSGTPPRFDDLASAMEIRSQEISRLVSALPQPQR
jgi:hypothetical protein